MKTICLNELEEWQDSDRHFAMIEVLPDKATRETQLPETRCRDFVEQIHRLGVSKNQAIVLYEGQSACIEAAAANEALTHEGYDEVYCFTGPRAPLYATQHGPA
jgi:3-mercaptopyruvate sulfurtransferase SseA